MKRVILSITGTVLGLVALLSFKAQGHPLTSTGALPSAGLPTTAPAPSSSAGTSSVTSPKASATPATSASAAALSKTLAGRAVQTQYGVVQVQVVVASSKIENVSFLQLTAFDGRSQDINSQAAPILLQETLAAQSSHIDTVSGASYTSLGYVQSLQSALDQVGIK
ncbi:MAG: FMN-binding protein [Actinomycetota bacterium]|nr:FMN-binding protein [Actinomycetota bacterium]